MRTPFIIGLLLAAALAGSSQAQTQTDMNIGAGKAYQAADRDLNVLYRRITAKLSPKEKTALVASQRAWIAYRDAECGFESLTVDGGSMQPMIRAACLEGLTRARTKALQAMTVDCREGDTACFWRRW